MLGSGPAVDDAEDANFDKKKIIFSDEAHFNLGITEPCFFENEQGEAVIVNGNRYRAKLN